MTGVQTCALPISNSLTFVYRNDETGNGASFNVGGLLSVQELQYNTDVICNYVNTNLDDATFNFPGNTSANLTNLTIGDALSFSNQLFGSILSLSNTYTGNGYDFSANVFVRSTLISKPMDGNVTYDTTSNTITGSSTTFEYFYQNNDVIGLKANSSLDSTLEFLVIKEVVSNTEILLYGPPTLNSTASSEYFVCPTILPAQFALYDEIMINDYSEIYGENEIIKGTPNSGNNIVSGTLTVDSGKGFVDGEQVFAYLYSSVSNNIIITANGVNYANFDPIIFAGGEPGTTADGYVITYSNGSITNAILTNGGSGYKEIPNLVINTEDGEGGKLHATLQEFNNISQIFGVVRKTGIGKGRGYWSTTRGFLNSDKYIQDSYYYQDFSYEIRTKSALNKYKNIIYNTFHNSGAELFGQILYLLQGNLDTRVIEESTYKYDTETQETIYLLCSEILSGFTADNENLTVDKYYV